VKRGEAERGARREERRRGKKRKEKVVLCVGAGLSRANGGNHQLLLGPRRKVQPSRTLSLKSLPCDAIALNGPPWLVIPLPCDGGFGE
jgi:hypothetical protein